MVSYQHEFFPVIQPNKKNNISWTFILVCLARIETIVILSYFRVIKVTILSCLTSTSNQTLHIGQKQFSKKYHDIKFTNTKCLNLVMSVGRYMVQFRITCQLFKNVGKSFTFSKSCQVLSSLELWAHIHTFTNHAYKGVRSLIFDDTLCYKRSNRKVFKI